MVDELVRGMDIFQDMQIAERQKMVQVLKPYIAEAGTRIIQQGESHSAVCVTV